MKTTHRPALFAAIAATLLAVITHPAPARADNNPAWPTACQSAQTIGNGRWQWVLGFNTTSAVWCMVTKDGAGVPTFETGVCVTHGAVNFGAGVAQFAGGYLACTFDPPGDGPTLLQDLDMVARAQIAGLPGGFLMNAMFVHPDAGLYLPQGSSTSPVMIASEINGIGRVSNTDQSGSLMQTYRATFQGSAGGGVRRHSLNYVAKAGWAEVPSNVTFNTGNNTVFIGYDPASGQAFRGIIDFIIVDPQYRPDCC